MCVPPGAATKKCSGKLIFSKKPTIGEVYDVNYNDQNILLKS